MELRRRGTTDDEREFRKKMRRVVKSSHKALRWVVWFLSKDKTPLECGRLGNWLMLCCAEFDAFAYDGATGILTYTERWRAEIAKLREEIIWRDPVILPNTTRPKDVVGWRTHFDDRLSYTFARCWHPDDKELIRDALKNGSISEHLRALNAQKDVPLLVDQYMVDLVDRWGVRAMKLKAPLAHPAAVAAQRMHAGPGRIKATVGDDPVDKVRAAVDLVERDVLTARMVGNRPLWLTYSVDRRGRFYPNEHFNYQREDHCRALFRFANGKKLGMANIPWLQIHVANCHGFADKMSFDDRVGWVLERHHAIERIAADPDGTFEEWSQAESPFAYVAACRELIAAYADPENFETHLPISFDGTCNAIQHWAAACRDKHSARLVNLTNTEELHDVYGHIIAHVNAEIEADAEDWLENVEDDEDDIGEQSVLWAERLKPLKPKQIRTLLKTPAMTVTYSATDWGLGDQVGECYLELLEEKVLAEAKAYLAEKIRRACKEILALPTEGMEQVRRIAARCIDQGHFPKWTSPSGVPFVDRYHKAETIRAILPSGAERIIATTNPQKVNRAKAIAAASANLVHSWDAAHAAKVVNASAAAGITDFLIIHDCFSCLASDAYAFQKVIKHKLHTMHRDYDMLALYRERNAAGDNSLGPLLLDAMLRMIGVVYTISCDLAGPDKAAKAVEAMYEWAALNGDNPLCAKFCNDLADAQAGMHHDFRTVGTA
jgi:DNA-directed RNA polymerase, mitochondrial